MTADQPMHEFPGINRALREGCVLKGFRSGGGLRVVRLQLVDAHRGYGEHPDIEEALNHLEEDFLAGGREYSEVYGKLYHGYITGSSISSSNLDAFILAGGQLKCWNDGNVVICQLIGVAHFAIPEKIRSAFDSNENVESITWKSNRGLTYRTDRAYDRFGNPSILTSLLSPQNARGMSWPITKEGTGDNLWSAILNALDAPGVEVLDS